jgi:ribosomal-protein-alanine N-acetyltransferase
MTLFREVDAATVSLHLRPDAVTALETRYRVTMRRPMCRMIIERAAFSPVTGDGASPLAVDHVNAILHLYADGSSTDESPDFFVPSMVERGIFFGIWDSRGLAAVAGTHLVDADVGICAIGNVYTRRDRRGEGLGRRVTSAVVAEAVRRELKTIVLNVRDDNASARQVYKQLGFTDYCTFVEGIATAGSPRTAETSERRRRPRERRRQRR